MDLFRLPNTPFTVDRAYAPQFRGLLDDLAAGGYVYDPDQSGGYNPRNIAGTNKPSKHASGRAIDINWARNRQGTRGDIPPDLARSLAKKHGLIWGGDWSNPDPMHFEVPGAASLPLSERSFTKFAGVGGPLPNQHQDTAMSDKNRYFPEDAINRQYEYADRLSNQRWSPTWPGVMAAMLGGLGGGLMRNSAQNALTSNQSLMAQALLNAGKAKTREDMSSALIASGVPSLQQSGVEQRMKALADDPNKPYRVRAAQWKQMGYTPETPGYREFVLFNEQPKSSGDANTPDERAALALKYGLDPSSDAYKSYVLTNKMPREDQQTLTATDKKAILEADETVASTDAAIASLDRALELSKKAYDGATANERAWITSQFGSEAGMATRELNQAVTQTALQQLKAIFGGNPTEGERKILLDIQGSAELPRESRDRILNAARDAAVRRLGFNKERAALMRGGTFYKPAVEGGGTVDPPTIKPPPADAKGAPRPRAINRTTGEIIEWNGSEWVPVQ